MREDLLPPRLLIEALRRRIAVLEAELRATRDHRRAYPPQLWQVIEGDDVT